MAEQLVVHDPRGYPPKVTGKPLAPRLESLSALRRQVLEGALQVFRPMLGAMQQVHAACPPTVSPPISSVGTIIVRPATMTRPRCS